MSKVLLILLFISALYYTDAITAEECQVTPFEKTGHCIIEHTVAHRFPHTMRYFFVWSDKRCSPIRWMNNCRLAPDPPTGNNFDSEASCLSACSGWA